MNLSLSGLKLKQTFSARSPFPMAVPPVKISATNSEFAPVFEKVFAVPAPSACPSTEPGPKVPDNLIEVP